MAAFAISDIPPLLGLLSILAVCVHGVVGKTRRPAAARAKSPAPVRIAGKVVAPGRRHRPTGFVVMAGVALAALVDLLLPLMVSGGDTPATDAMAQTLLRGGAVVLGYAGLLNALLIALQLLGRRRAAR